MSQKIRMLSVGLVLLLLAGCSSRAPSATPPPNLLTSNPPSTQGSSSATPLPDPTTITFTPIPTDTPPGGFVTLVPNQDYEDYENSGFKFKTKVHKDWKKVVGQRSVTFSSRSEDKFPPRMLIMMTDTALSASNLSDAASAAYANLIERYKTIPLENERNITLAGKPGLEYDFTTQWDGVTVSGRLAFTITNGKLVILQFLTRDTDFFAWEDGYLLARDNLVYPVG